MSLRGSSWSWFGISAAMFVIVLVVMHAISLRTDICASCRSLAALIYKPSDYNSSLFDGNFDIAKESIVTIKGNLAYSGRYAIYVNAADSGAPRTRDVRCVAGGIPLEVASEVTRVTDRVGSGWSIASFNVGSTISRREVVCQLYFLDEIAGRVRVRLVKQSEL